MIFYMGIQKFLFTFFNIYILSLSRLNRSVVAYVAGAWKQWAQEKTGAREGDTRVSLARARSLFRPLLPSTCYAGYGVVIGTKL